MDIVSYFKVRPPSQVLCADSEQRNSQFCLMLGAKSRPKLCRLFVRMTNAMLTAAAWSVRGGGSSKAGWNLVVRGEVAVFDGFR